MKAYGFTKFAPKDPSKYWGRFSPDFSSSEFNLSDVYDYEGYFTDWAKNLVRDDYQGESGDCLLIGHKDLHGIS